MFEKRRHLKETIKAQSKLIHKKDETISTLRSEVEELEFFKDIVTSIMKSKNSIVNKHDKINELVNDFDSNY